MKPFPVTTKHKIKITYIEESILKLNILKFILLRFFCLLTDLKQLKLRKKNYNKNCLVISFKFVLKCIIFYKKLPGNMEAFNYNKCIAFEHKELYH